MIGNQFKLVNRIGTIPQTVGRQPLSLDVGAPMTGIDLRMRYTVTNGGTAPIGVQYGAILQLAQLVQRAEQVVYGEDSVMSLQPWLYIARFVQERGGVFPRGFDTPINM